MRIPWSTTYFLAAILATWRITHLLWAEDGPANIFVGLRRLAGRSFFGALLDCFYCLSLWIAAPLAWLLATAWLERGLLWFAISGGAILLERATANLTTSAAPPALWHEEPLSHDEDESQPPARR